MRRRRTRLSMHKVLLVDDEPLALEGLKFAVKWESLGYEIAGECGDGEEAVSLIEKLHPELVITDIRMPGLDGLGLIEHVKKHYSGDVRFIILSGYAEFEYAREALKYGVKHYLLKPVFEAELKEVLLEIGKQFGTLDRNIQADGNHLVDGVTCLNAIVEAFEDFNPVRLESAIESAFTHFQTELLTPEIVALYVTNIIYHSIDIIREMRGDPAGLLQKYPISNMDWRKTTLAELKRMLKSYAAECCLYLQALQDRNSQADIYQIEAYIRENFKQNLTIKEVSKRFYMHPAYFGQLFHKKFGLSFNEYLHRMRIEEAKRLMDRSSKKAHEIATEVGYNNYQSFLEYFERFTGMKPTDYKTHRCLG